MYCLKRDLTKGVCCICNFFLASKIQVILLNHLYCPSYHQCSSCQFQPVSMDSVCQSSFTTNLSIAQTNSRIKHSMFEDQPAPPSNHSPIICHFPKVGVTPEVPGEFLSNLREEERSLREQGWCTGSHYHLW